MVPVANCAGIAGDSLRVGGRRVVVCGVDRNSTVWRDD